MSVAVRFYLDEHVHSAIAEGLRRRGIDVLTTQEADMLGASDEAHLKFALDEGRVIFTQDDDFLKLQARGLEHAGIIYVRQQTPVGYIVRGLVLIHQLLSTEEMKGQVEFL
jgi:predicted nuclease of predicted toxin-antitoxin system